MNMRSTQHIDLPALLLSAVLTVALAVSAAWWYGIRWQDITSSGFFGFPVFAGMFVVAIGIPSYLVVRYFRSRHK